MTIERWAHNISKRTDLYKVIYEKRKDSNIIIGDPSFYNSTKTLKPLQLAENVLSHYPMIEVSLFVL